MPPHQATAYSANVSCIESRAAIHIGCRHRGMMTLPGSWRRRCHMQAVHGPPPAQLLRPKGSQALPQSAKPISPNISHNVCDGWYIGLKLAENRWDGG